MSQLNIEGGCMCGRIRYKLTCRPVYSTMCHCSDCRRACGAQAVAWVTVADEHFLFTRQSPQSYKSSPEVTRTFCPVCGTSLTYVNKNRHQTDITTASLDHPEEYPPTQDYFCRDRLPWLKPATNSQKE